ncbi:MAG: 4Fe-4S double cluster binding domain-containing protein [Dehalogenimonas sp.]
MAIVLPEHDARYPTPCPPAPNNTKILNMTIASQAIAALQSAGYKARAVDALRLADLRSTFEIMDSLGFLDPALAKAYLQFKYSDFSRVANPQTIFIVSVHQPITRATFTHNGRAISADIPPTYLHDPDDALVESVLKGVVEAAGYNVERARLPVKTLAAASSLAKYGRNNVAYIPGFGSFNRLLAFVSDCPSPNTPWTAPEMMKACDKCRLCLDACPTRCISPHRFPVHAENCLTWFNEREDRLPDWLGKDAHNALVGCMKCQLVCPVNKKQLNNVVSGPDFTEEETGMVLGGAGLEAFQEETRVKLVGIGFEEISKVLARNLKLLIEKNS